MSSFIYQIFVKYLNKTFIVDVEASDNYFNLLFKIIQKTNLDFTNILLIYNGKFIKENQFTIPSKNSLIIISITMKGGGKSKKIGTPLPNKDTAYRQLAVKRPRSKTNNSNKENNNATTSSNHQSTSAQSSSTANLVNI
uniref:Ubiquitin-like domain-containing protein n=2 Tax=Meloidogyne hapla TaxID=6305 RepID=A0A1I8BSV6_MELHA